MDVGNVGTLPPGTKLSRASHAWEYECFSRLGPLTRDVLNYALLPISAADVYVFWERRGALNDARIAEDLKTRVATLTGVPYARAVVQRRYGKSKQLGAAVREERLVSAAQGAAVSVVA